MFRFVSMDTEFPGTIFKPSKEIIEQGDPAINYDYMKANVDALEATLCELDLPLPLAPTPLRFGEGGIWTYILMQ
ncbi:hypothetical protein V6N13_114960 [Hibiscus sabdariffa]